MTLIAFHAGADLGELVTDESWNSRNFRYVGTGTKVFTVPHLRLAHATNGSSDFAAAWQYAAAGLFREASSFDELLEHIPAILAGEARRLDDMVAQRRARGTLNPDTHRTRASVYTVGYSPLLGRFRAVGFEETNDPAEFTAIDLTGTHVIPAPYDLRPSPIEWNQIEWVTQRAPAPGDDEALAEWAKQPAPEHPATLDGWAQLARRARADRTLAPWGSRVKVLIGGTLRYTAISADGTIMQLPIGRFEDSPAMLARVFEGTMHPAGQVGPCPCGSGKRFRACCIEANLNEPCSCESALTLGECCALDLNTFPGAVPRLPAPKETR